jgi:hypothetical protein
MSSNKETRYVVTVSDYVCQLIVAERDITLIN